MEKHLFTQLKYQVQSEDIRDRQVRRTHIKDDINSIIEKNYIERELRRKAGKGYYE